MDSFPKYIWNTKTKKLSISNTGMYFLDSSEYGDGGPLTFDDKQQVKKFLKENNFHGKLGVTLFIN